MTSYRDEILNLPQFCATTAHPLSNGTSTISASERHVLIARFMAVSQELALNIAARADAEIAELRRDAERYRWLRDKGGLDIDAPWCVFQGRSQRLPSKSDWHGRNELDAAIDAARGGE